MLLWLEQLGASSQLYGTDIDPDAIAWCQANIPYAHTTVNSADPPLPYPDGTFDLVYNHSVFTHIDERRQDLWLSELHRVTKDGALLVLSTHGEVALDQAPSSFRDRAERDGIVFIDDSLPADFPLPDWYQMTFHAPWYVFEHWGRWFEVRAYLAGAALGLQDHVLLERPANGAKPRHTIAPRPVRPAPGRPAAGRSASKVAAAVATGRSIRAQADSAPSRFGASGRLARRAVLRAIRPYTTHEDQIDDAVVASVEELMLVSEEHEARLRELESRG
jgi:SAM-dependent methyltransferase